MGATSFHGYASPNYTQVPDELFDKQLPDLSGAELKALLYIIRRTFGFKKESDNISLNQLLHGITTRAGERLDRGTGLSRSTLVTAFKGLAAKGLIIVEQRSSAEKGNEATNYRLNVRYHPSSKIIPGESENRTRLVRKPNPQETARHQTDIHLRNSNGNASEEMAPHSKHKTLQSLSTLMATRKYPQRSVLIQQLTPLLKASRRPVQLENMGMSWAGPTGSIMLDRHAGRALSRLTHILSQNEYFEYMTREDIQRAILELLATYARERHGNIKNLATQFLDDKATEPDRATLYFGVRHLTIDGVLNIGDSTIVGRRSKAFLRRAVPVRVYRRNSSYVRVQASGGTSSALRSRGRQKAELALALLRLYLRRGLGTAHREQLLFSLTGDYVRETEDGNLSWAWWRIPAPISVNLGKPSPEWREPLTFEADAISRLAGPFRDRVHNALWWLDSAMRPPTWRTRIPEVFTAMESLLVPEDCPSKAEVVTVRSIALQLSFDDWFTSPDDTYFAYLVRCALIHGEPIPENVNASRQDDTWQLEHWADEILSAYIKYVTDSGCADPRVLSGSLDESVACQKACNWLIGQGDRGAKLVADYRKAVLRQPPPEKPPPACQ